MDGIPPTAIMGGLALVAFGGWSLAAYFGRLVYVGKLVPAVVVERELAAAAAAVDKAEHDGSEWRTEGRLKDAQIAEKDTQLAVKDQQLGHLKEVGETQRAVLTALQRMASDEVER